LEQLGALRQYVDAVDGRAASAGARGSRAVLDRHAEAAAHGCATREHRRRNAAHRNDDHDAILRAQLLIWDEAFSATESLFKSFDNFLRQLRDCDAPMGGLPTLLIGYSHQTPHSGRWCSPR
jgi:hypothetical protein